MRAKTPEEICRLFKQYMAEGNIESLVELYDAEAVFLSESGAVKTGKEEIREQLAPLAAAKTRFEFKIMQIVRAGDIALMHTQWQTSPPGKGVM